MASLTIHDIDPWVLARLQARADRHGRALEDEARVILCRAVGGISSVGVTGAALWAQSRRLFHDGQGVELDLLSRDGDRASPDFEDGDA